MILSLRTILILYKGQKVIHVLKDDIKDDLVILYTKHKKIAHDTIQANNETKTLFDKKPNLISTGHIIFKDDTYLLNLNDDTITIIRDTYKNNIHNYISTIIDAEQKDFFVMD